MKRTKTIVAIVAVAIIAGVSIFMACTKEENKKLTHVQDIVSSIHDKDLSEDELNELIHNYDVKVTMLDSVYSITTYYYTNADFCVKTYADVDNTTFTGLCFFEGESQYTFTWLNDNKIRLDCDDFADSVFLKDLVFNEDEGKITFDFKVGEFDHIGTTIEVSETVMASFMGFTNGNITSLPPIVGAVIGPAIGGYIVSKVMDVLKENARQCNIVMAANVRECIRAGGSPSVTHGVFHHWCSFTCNMPNPNPDN